MTNNEQKIKNFKKYNCEMTEEISKCYDYNEQYWGDSKRINYQSFFEIIKEMNNTYYPLSLYERFIKFRNINSQARTLEKSQLRFGLEKGTERFNNYCKKQAETNTFEYKRKKYGWTEEQFREYNLSRAVTLENLVSKHGEEEGTRIYQEYCEKQKYVGVNKKYFIEKYGEEEGIQKFNEMIEKKLKALFKVLNVGVSSLERQIINSLHSSEYHFYVNYELEEGEYKDININSIEYQFNLYSEKYNTRFFYDACILDRKILVEINGDFWHYNKRNKHVKEAFKKETKLIDCIKKRMWRDEAKIKLANESGFVVYSICELDWKNHSKEIIEHFKKWVIMKPTTNYSTEETYGNQKKQD